ncbi:flagellar hook-length control protein FliK [Nesterenkonia halotolerans]|uniref:flagellar hook-length control protein FliK n=1 Tax=Nesterenkonia halotolerans TaxID=225325 RepID=UPI003EE5A5C2
MPINHTPDTGVKAGVTAETPLAPAGSAPTTAPTLVSGSMGQSGGIPPTAAPAPAAAPQPTAPAAAPLQVQLAGPIAQLATGPAGEKILTVNVAPENLGPVTVRANISGDAMRIELFAPQEAGREALRGMLTELRRDLAGLGLGSSQVSLGEGDPPSSSSGQPRGDAQMGERSRDPAAGQQPAEDSGSRDQQRGPNAEQVLDQLSGAPAVSRLVGSALLPEAPHPVGLDLLA